MLSHFDDLHALVSVFMSKDTAWTSLRIDHETPVVERVYTQLGDVRLAVHRIYPCEKAMYHPHPWPSAVLMLKGEYEMGVGYGVGVGDPPLAMTQRVVAGSSYEMLDPNGWHYVRPLREPTISVMVNGPAWKPAVPRAPVRVPHHALLSEDAARLVTIGGLLLRALAYERQPPWQDTSPSRAESE